MAKFCRNLASLLVTIVCIIIVNNGTNAKMCATLFIEKNYKGKSYDMLDESSVSNFEEEYTSVDSVWNSTLSFKVETGCKFSACNDTHFDGMCKNFSKSIEELPEDIANILSANCVCPRTCSCSDIRMRRTSCARAYFGGCNVCNPVYTDFRGEKSLLPTVFHNKIDAIKVRDGCKLSVFTEEEFQGEEMEIVGTRDWHGNIESYKCSCDAEQQTAESTQRSLDYPPLIDVPSSIENVTLMLKGEFKHHQGLVAALRSLQNRRSATNAYIMVLGSTGAGKSTAINFLFDNPSVTRVGLINSTTTDIHEFRIKVPVDELGIQNSELRIIDTPGLGDTRGLEQDAKFLATFDDYLSNHEELKTKIPNVVLIFHKFNDNRIAGDGSVFVKMLKGLDSFRTRITDENYSNVIFVFTHFMSEMPSITKKPRDRLLAFKDIIETYGLFPKPVVLTVAENMASELGLLSINGYFKLPNGEFYPRNLFDKIQTATSSGGDAIGDAVIRSAFRSPENFNITQIDYKISGFENNKISKYYNILAGTIIDIGTTEVSQMIEAAYEKMSTDLKKRFPGALPLLQRALNIRYIRTKQDIPTKALDILELLSNLKHTEANTFLLKEGLKLNPPVYDEKVLTGYSYNVFKDTDLPKSPFQLGEKINTDIGYLLPSAMTCSVSNQVKDFLKFFPTKMDYLSQRVSSLGIDGILEEKEFFGEIRPGFNIQSENFLNGSCKITAVREIRTFELVLNDKPELTPEFTDLLKRLPVFNETDEDSVKIWNDLFDEYGTHVVKSVFGGGAIEIHLQSNTSCGQEIIKTLFSFIQFAEDLTVINDDSAAALKRQGVKHILKFKGGNKNFHASDLTKMSVEDASQLLSKWKKSLRFNPTILNTELKLLPLSILAKNIGQRQNISTEIEIATSLRFQSALKYTPPRKQADIEPESGREETPVYGAPGGFSDIMKLIMSTNEARTKQFETIIASMHKENLDAERKREEQRRKDLKYIKEMEEMRISRLRIENAEREEKEQERIKELQTITATIEKKALEKQQQQIMELQSIIQVQRDNIKLIRSLVLEDSAAERAAKRNGSTSICLKKGTPILLADKTAKPVETIQVGDILLDHEMKPTRVIGISYEFLRTETFYGFDNESFFFTDSHMLVGPGENQGMQIYTKNLKALYEENPLMEFMNAWEMDDHNSFPILVWQESNTSISPKDVHVFKDPAIYPEDTFTYFLQVDSPSGTYIANNYVCRHDIPPIHIWPNTMALLFHLYSVHPALKLLENVPYTLEMSTSLKQLAVEVREQVQDTLDAMADGGISKLKKDEPRYEFGNVDIDSAIAGVFNQPAAGSLAVAVYAASSKIIADFLDPTSKDNSDFEPYIGSMQKMIADAIAAQIETSFQNILPQLH